MEQIRTGLKLYRERMEAIITERRRLKARLARLQQPHEGPGRLSVAPHEGPGRLSVAQSLDEQRHWAGGGGDSVLVQREDLGLSTISSSVDGSCSTQSGDDHDDDDEEFMSLLGLLVHGADVMEAEVPVGTHHQPVSTHGSGHVIQTSSANASPAATGMVQDNSDEGSIPDKTIGDVLKSMQVQYCTLSARSLSDGKMSSMLCANNA